LEKPKARYTLTDLVFGISPRIHAAGPIKDARGAVKLLISDCEESALLNSQGINQLNDRRKEHDQLITSQALQLIDTDPAEISRKTTVLYQPHWHKGVIGIVASRLIEKYYRPTVILTESNGLASGSARSVAGFDLYRALCACEDLLEQFGGHTFAAGLTLKKE